MSRAHLGIDDPIVSVPPLDPFEIVFEVLAFLFGLSVHEAAHAYTADKLGDDTARRLGRLTLNPLPHIDIFGTIVLPAVGIISGLPVLGWAKPTPVNPSRLRNPRRDDILVTVAGPVSNVLVAACAMIVLLALRVSTKEAAIVIEQFANGYDTFVLKQNSHVIVPIALLFHDLMGINLLLAVFNLIPIPPLDGGQIVAHLIPLKWRPAYLSFARFSYLLLVVLLVFGVPYRIFEPVFRVVDSVFK